MIELRQPNITDTETERVAYNDIYNDQGIEQRDSLYIWLVDLLKAKPGQILLDISCGQGKLVGFAIERKLRASGLDFSEVALNIAARRYGRASFAVSDAHRLPVKSQSVDFVTNIGSIEHYMEPPEAVREMSRILKPAGTACILLPNTYSLLGNVKHVAQTGEVYQGPQPLERYNTLNGWRRLLSENGLPPFKTVKFERVMPRTWTDLSWSLCHPPKLLHALLTPLIPLPLVDSFVYLCRPDSRY